MDQSSQQAVAIDVTLQTLFLTVNKKGIWDWAPLHMYVLLSTWYPACMRCIVTHTDTSSGNARILQTGTGLHSVHLWHTLGLCLICVSFLCERTHANMLASMLIKFTKKRMHNAQSCSDIRQWDNRNTSIHSFFLIFCLLVYYFFYILSKCMYAGIQ